MSLRISLIKKSALYIGKKTVIKVAKLGSYEMKLVHDFPNVFMTTKSFGNWIHVMPKGYGFLTIHNSEYLAAINLLKTKLWDTFPVESNPEWKRLLMAHVRNIYPSSRLLDRVWDLDDGTGTDRIHGDATLENVVWTPDLLALRWIDPCWRPYLPTDRRVDVAKMMQSAWNFEGVVHYNEKPRFFDHLAEDIKKVTSMKTADDETIDTWLCIHLARLLRYQSKRTRELFREVLEDVYSCSV
jgi:hypothetical protein